MSDESIVLQLQKAALNPGIPVSSLLRRAKLLATKLGSVEQATWIERELGGYPLNSDHSYPAYRRVTGEMKALNPYHGWQPIIFEDKNVAKSLSERYVGSSIAEIEDLLSSAKEKPFGISITSELKGKIQDAIGITLDIGYFVDRSSMVVILEAVRTAILDWTVRLEKENILEPSTPLTPGDQKKASAAAKIINFYNFGSFSGVVGNIGDGANVSVGERDAEFEKKLTDLLEHIIKVLPDISLGVGEREKVQDDISGLDREITAESPNRSRINDLLLSIQSIMENTAGNLFAYGIIAYIQHLL
jgi:hypothetical protein